MHGLFCQIQQPSTRSQNSQLCHVGENTSISLFPPAIRHHVVSGQQPSKKSDEIIDAFIKYQNERLGLEEGKVLISNHEIHLLRRMSAATDNLKTPRSLKFFLNQLKRSNNYQASTLLRHLSLISKFLIFVRAYCSKIVVIDRGVHWYPVRCSASMSERV